MARIPHVIIVGAGFAGLYAARELGNKPVRVTVLDRKNHHTFQPLLYQVATAGLSPGEIAVPIRSILSRFTNIGVLLGEVTGFDLDRHRVKIQNDDELQYDYLIVAAGATHAYFGHDEWATYAPGLKSVEDATEIRRRILLAFELAERKARLDNIHEPLNFVVVGAGPTGVELAGALVEIARRALVRDFRSVDPSSARVILVEAGPRVLAAYPEDLSHSAEQQLKQLGVEVMLNAMVTGIGPDYIQIGEKRLPTAVTLWGAGVSASSLATKLVEAAKSTAAEAPSTPATIDVAVPKLDRAGRVIVSPDLTIPGHAEVFVVGDLASVTYGEGKPVPGIAPAAIQMGRYAARTILKDVQQSAQHGKSREPFRYHDKGSLATIGRKAAVGLVYNRHLTGFVAWLAWLFVHIFFLIGFRNRIAVIYDWAWAYFTYQRGARLITGNSRSIAPIATPVPAEVPPVHELNPVSTIDDKRKVS